ncbi:glycosyltransferase [Nocardioides marmorisolisilvae]|uniref:Glycosyltransferase n=1 Tax=Nocardioides marmorisolisilvae TaxID=1542737 RepID=A0A3N0DSQ6_9ACTN|nr:nucleotide disphospho-sugar-binding domain-containing protein [Nocardioides marmorisolisilvae]RNL78649.1 glycosyltransferase [Nocardioides marmorisolisilvae]
MARIVIATWDGGGNVPPLLGIGAELERRGHAVRVIGHAGQAATVAAAGLDFVVYPTARPFTSQRNNPPWTLAAAWAGADLGRDVVAEADSFGADLVVVDCLLPGAMAALHAAGRRYVVVEHLFDGFLPKLLKGPIGGLVRLRGVRWADGLANAEARLIASVPSLDPAAGSLAPNAVHTGPVLTAAPAQPEQPTILVSLSTYAYTGIRATLQRVLDACADLPARVVVTTGPVVDPDELRLPENAEAHRWVPHAELMPQVSLVIGHGGHSTTMLALAHDLPVLVLPMHPMVDQPMVGAAVEQAGAGRRLPKKSSPARLRPVIAELLGEGPHRAAAARLGAEARALNGASNAADRIEALVPNGVRP